MVSAGNKKPLSSFPAEAESPRGAVLRQILSYTGLLVNFALRAYVCLAPGSVRRMLRKIAAVASATLSQ